LKTSIKYITSFVILLGLVLLFANFKMKKANPPTTSYCPSAADTVLYKMIMKYRDSLDLDTISLSNSLCYVALSHTLDLKMFNPNKPPCNLHSWSNNGIWSSCCYTPDHLKASCMWGKPREMTSYRGDGFEIATYYSAGMTPKKALEAWQKSKGHNEVIVNKGIWKTMKWRAIGISIYDNYAVVWFGTERDPDNTARCK